MNVRTYLKQWIDSTIRDVRERDNALHNTIFRMGSIQTPTFAGFESVKREGAEGFFIRGGSWLVMGCMIFLC